MRTLDTTIRMQARWDIVAKGMRELEASLVKMTNDKAWNSIIGLEAFLKPKRLFMQNVGDLWIK